MHLELRLWHVREGRGYVRLSRYCPWMYGSSVCSLLAVDVVMEVWI